MNPRRFSHLEKALNVLDKSVTTHVLRDDQYLLFLLKKTERIVAALYVITNSFSDYEPLKWNIRESGTSLIKHILSFKERMKAHNREPISDTFAEIARLLSILDLAHIADLLSPMNSSVLKNEIEGLTGTIENKWRASNLPTHAPSLEESFFGIPRNTFSNTKEDRSKTSIPNLKNTEPNTEESTTLYAFGDLERLLRSQKDNHKGHVGDFGNVLDRKPQTLVQDTQAKHTDVSYTDFTNHQIDTREERMQKIISVLRKHGNSATIRDFSAIIKGCSEKTIQRLLIEMVQGGVLKKSGNRRWSRYSIVEEVKTV